MNAKSFPYERLSPQDFEGLAADVLAHREGVTFERFAEGPDGGIDLRYAAPDRTVIIGQAKRVNDFRRLERLVIGERDKLQRLNPTSYRLITSCPLTPERKQKLQRTLAPWAQDPSDIIGRNELDAALQKRPDLLRRHVKLWLQDSEQLRAVLHRAEEGASREGIEALREGTRAFVHHPRVEIKRDWYY